jgi:hypothetical protein
MCSQWTEHGGTRTEYARKIYATTNRRYAQEQKTVLDPVARGFTCLCDDMSFDAASLFISWLRLAAHEKFVHFGGGTGRLVLHAHLLTRARAYCIETTERRTAIAVGLLVTVRTVFWRCPEWFQGVATPRSAHRFVRRQTERVGLIGDVLFLSDARATPDEQRRMDASLATCTFRVIASYRGPGAWRSLRPCTTIEPNSMTLAHATGPQRIFLYEPPPYATAPLMQPRAREIKPPPYRGWARDVFEDLDSSEDDTEPFMDVDKR